MHGPLILLPILFLGDLRVVYYSTGSSKLKRLTGSLASKLSDEPGRAAGCMCMIRLSLLRDRLCARRAYVKIRRVNLFMRARR